MPYTFAALASEYAALWRSMSIAPSRKAEFDAVAKRLYASRARYESVAKATGVPPAIIAVIHEREADANFNCHLHNGDPLNARTYHVPAGRPPPPAMPPFTWEESAIDALQYEGLSKIVDWSLERGLYVLENFNGPGYRNRGLRSPYLWGGTNQQQPGKYVADGVFDPNVMDQQLGCAGLLMALAVIDPTWRLPLMSEQKPVPASPPPPPPDVPLPRPRPPMPSPTPTPSQQGFWALIIAAAGIAYLSLHDWAIHVWTAFLHFLGF